jgi:hypothetical protein
VDSSAAVLPPADTRTGGLLFRLTRNYETLNASSEAVIHIASIDNLAKRITDETTPTWRGVN